MLYPTTLNEIETNTNPGIEYEIALFAKLIESNKAEYESVISSIRKRIDSYKIIKILGYSDITKIIRDCRLIPFV